MKDSDIKVFFFVLIMVCSSLILGLGTINRQLYYWLYWTIMGIFSCFIFGVKKDRTKYKVDYIQVVLIYVLSYLVITYLGGLLFGFSIVPYSLTPIKILENLIFPILLILAQERLRFTLINDRGKYKSILFSVALSFALIEILYLYSNYDVSSALGIYELIGQLIIPSIARNLLLTYLTSRCGFFPSLVYRFLMDLYIFFVPIIPDFGVYIDSILAVTFPTILYLKFYSFLAKEQYQAREEKSKIKIFLYIPLIALVVTSVFLVSGVFKYSALSIGSGSMRDAIQVGDVVIVEKLKNEELDEIQVGDILVYSHDNEIIVHRVVKIRQQQGSNVYRTKGDNNQSEDNYDIEEKDVIGIVKAKIPYIGYPSVWIREQLS